MRTQINQNNIDFEIIHGKVNKVWWIPVVSVSDTSCLMMEFSDDEIEASEELLAECYVDRRGIGLPKPTVFDSKDDALKFASLFDDINITENDLEFSEIVFFNEGCYKISNIE